MPIICNLNHKELEIVKNEMFTINMILDHSINISNDETESIIHKTSRVFFMLRVVKLCI